jgi:long-chain acyl-CoA synthetase
VAVEDVYRQIPYVEQVVVFGDGHKRLVALMCLRHDELQQCMTNKVDPTLTNSATPSVEQFFCNDLDAVDARLPVYERIRAVGILSGPLCTERGELTANGKLRRRAIETNFCELLDRLYREEDSAENRCVLFEAEPPNRT